MPFGSLLSATAGGRQTGGVDLKLSEIVHRYTQKLLFFWKSCKKSFLNERKSFQKFRAEKV